MKGKYNMSAYQVNRETIDLIVSVLVDWGRDGRHVYTYGDPPTDTELLAETEVREGYNYTRTDYTTADALGRELIDVNVRSLATRYSDGIEMCTYYAETYTFDRVWKDDDATVFQAMGAIRCYQYQACEIADWRDSFAYHLTEAAMRALVGLVSDGWDYERPARVVKRVSIMDIIEQNRKAGK